MDSTTHLSPRLDPNGGCTKETCVPSESIYGYRSSLPATLIFLIVFFVSGCVYVVQGVKSKTWFFSGIMAVGCLSEVLGYIAKMIFWDDPFSDAGFKMSLVHICLTFGPGFSRLRPSWYTWIFITADCISMLFQAIGGGLAAAAPDIPLLIVGDDIMITGLTTQVFTMLAFGVLAGDYAYAVWKNRALLNPETTSLRGSLRFRCFTGALWLAYICILIRCAYRLAKLVDGCGPDNPILRDQASFIGLDSVPCGIASTVLNVWHPGWCFPRDREEAVIQAAATTRVAGYEEKIDV